MRRAIPADSVEVWVVRPGDATGAAFADSARGMLAPGEAERAARFRFDEHRREYLVTRALARRALSAYRDVAPAAWRFEANEHGRPRPSPPCGLHFNLSNTPTLVVCAVSEHRELGVDVEPLSRAPAILEVAATVFTGRERADLAALPPPLAASRAVSLWTCKEAVMKARGLGMVLPPKEITLTWPAGGHDAPRVTIAPAWDDGRAWTLRTVDVDDHRVALCVEAAPPVELELVVCEAASLPPMA
jgi:4'-phosphopantetheinyl transferase